MMIANSSPPSRATVSPARVTALSRSADGHEQPVALGVTEAIVHGLEVVEVEKEDRRRLASAAGPRESVTEAVQEQEAVLQPGQHVVERLVPELLLEDLALRDVAVVDDDTADGRIVEQVLGDRLERPPRVVGMTGPEFDPRLRNRSRPPRRPDPRSTVGRSSGWMSVADRLADPFVRTPAEDALDGRALVADQAILAEHDDAVGRVLDERPETLLVALHVDEEEAFGRGLLLETAVLAPPARATRHRTRAR